jgi:cysteine desulfurase
MSEPVYLDCNATTPIEPEVLDTMVHYCRLEYGNAGSRTHRYGSSATKAVRAARERVAAVLDASWEEVVFTSGATEANNIAILGLSHHAKAGGKLHIVSTQIEHKAVLEPLEVLREQGFDVTLLPVSSSGAVEPEHVRAALRPETALVSIMHVNNETGVIQPLREIAEAMQGHSAALHTDAAQGFGKDLEGLLHPRIDMISVSGHKLYAPKGIGALVVRSGLRTKGLKSVMYGGGQERGLRPGTVPVHLAAALGVAAELAVKNHLERRDACVAFRDALLAALAPLNPWINGELSRSLPSTLNLSFGDIDSEAVMIGLKDLVAISNGSACTSASYTPSHVLTAMNLPKERVAAATRWSWCHMSQEPDWNEIADRVRALI